MAHEHEFEAAPGLPEKLPVGERILWQGAPDAWLLAVHALHVRKLALYFALMLAAQAIFMRAEGQSLVGALALSTSLAALALVLLGATAWMAARNTLYTVTNRRVVMRIGIVLTLSFNLPFKQLAGASIRPLARGHGDVALQLKGARIAWLHLWPHARAWHLRQPQPTLRCVKDAQAVGALIQRAWQAVNQGVNTQVQAANEPQVLPSLHAVAKTAAG